MATNPQARVLELLKRFNDGKKICIQSLQYDPMWYEKSEKTIRRDFRCYKRVFKRVGKLSKNLLFVSTTVTL